MSTEQLLLEPAVVSEPVESPRRWLREAVRTSPSVAIGGVLVLAIAAVTLLGPLVWTKDPNGQGLDRLSGLSGAHPMGTDALGRDTLARVIHGAQVSLQVSIVGCCIALVAGLAIGVTAAFYGRATDAVLMRVVDIMFAFPGLVLAILVAGLLGPSRLNATLTAGLVFSPPFARVARATALAILAQPFMEAARALGASRRRLLFRELLPNIAGPLIAAMTVYISAAILLEAGLSFLGLGTQPPEASWGNMLADARTYMELAWWLAVFPGAAIALAVLGFSLLGDGLRDILDPRSRRR
jgi:peptide/nickel transport system permease protein